MNLMPPLAGAHAADAMRRLISEASELEVRAALRRLDADADHLLAAASAVEGMGEQRLGDLGSDEDGLER